MFMSELVILSCTNRPSSNTLKVSRIYEGILKAKDIPVKLLDFCDLPENIAFTETFGKRSERFDALVDEYIRPAGKFIFVMPEYNGSFPGILKTFIDSIPPREWNNKDACLVGVADGRAGNLRGLEHLTGILNYLKMHVYHNKLPISVITRIMDDKGQFTSEEQYRECVAQVEGFLAV
jgi:chromate reductase, NAD(P)H dehydrogenase (quinone)